jgi:hypothetical protein
MPELICPICKQPIDLSDLPSRLKVEEISEISHGKVEDIKLAHAKCINGLAGRP